MLAFFWHVEPDPKEIRPHEEFFVNSYQFEPKIAVHGKYLGLDWCILLHIQTNMGINHQDMSLSGVASGEAEHPVPRVA